MKFSKFRLLILLFLGLPLCVQAEEYQEGFLTSHLNRAIEKVTPSNSWASAPQFGGYINGQYCYDDKSGNHGGNGFGIRLLRMYVSGSLLNDFKYRVQVEMNGSVALRDATIEWARWKEFSVKAGQFKRCFTYSNPTHPMLIGNGVYPQIVNKLAGFGDYCGEPSVNGRDIGLQFSGDLFPVGRTGHRLIRYEAAVYNGNGQNRADNNGQKDWIGNLQVQPIPNLYVALFGWKGNYTQDGVTVGRNRWGLGAKYTNDKWTAYAEYAHNTGHRIQDYDADSKTWSGTGRADAWYATLGYQLTPWLQPFLRYDAYREQATWESAKSIYSVVSNFTLHKNLMFQLQYNFVHDKPYVRDRKYNELKALFYIRF